MAGTQQGALKTAAKRLGLTPEEYKAHVDAGEKWCRKCRNWKFIDNFSADKTRGDGRKYLCKSCEYTRKTSGPGKQERQIKLRAGLVYCRGCNDWLPKDVVHAGLCRKHANEEARQRYATDPNYRNERRQHAHSRKRGTDPIPIEGQETILSSFAGKCAYCGDIATTWDHVIPISKGGMTVPYNIVPACSTCNSSKGDKDWFTWAINTGKELPQEFFDRIDLEWCGL